MRYAAAMLVGLSACESLGVRSCTDILVPGIRIDFVDAQTNAAVFAANARVVASEGRYGDTTVFVGDGAVGPLFVVDDRPGTYRVRAEVTGYRAWQQDVRVEASDRCHVRTTRVTAQLER